MDFSLRYNTCAECNINEPYPHTKGAVDQYNGLWYCDGCWAKFNSNVEKSSIFCSCNQSGKPCNPFSLLFISKLCDQCAYCIIKIETNSMLDSINSAVIGFNIPEGIPELIAEFSIGYIIKCSNYSACGPNYSGCNTQIIINNKYDFMQHENKAYNYSVNISNIKKNHKDKLVRLYDKLMAFYCEPCGLQAHHCPVNGCDNKYRYQTSLLLACLNHTRCDSERCDNPIEIGHMTCTICNNAYCTTKRLDAASCTRIRGLDINLRPNSKIVTCKSCRISHRRILLQDKLSEIKINGSAIGLQLIHLIVSYSMGYSVDCCNNNCSQIIEFDDISEFRRKRDRRERTIEYYAPKLDLKETVIIFGERLRIFCAVCAMKDGTGALDDCCFCLNRKVKTKIVCQNHVLNCKVCNKEIVNRNGWEFYMGIRTLSHGENPYDVLGCPQCENCFHDECELRCSKCDVLNCQCNDLKCCKWRCNGENYYLCDGCLEEHYTYDHLVCCATCKGEGANECLTCDNNFGIFYCEQCLKNHTLDHCNWCGEYSYKCYCQSYIDELGRYDHHYQYKKTIKSYKII